MPVMVAWVGGLIAAADRRGAPSFWLLPLMALWANLHGGFVLGLALVAPIAIDAVLNADAAARKSLALRWAVFGLAPLVAACSTPYGWDAMLAARRILDLGAGAGSDRRMAAGEFRSSRPLEGAVMLGSALALWRGVMLPPIRIVLLRRIAAHGAEPRPQRRSAGAARADGAGRTLGASDRRRRCCQGLVRGIAAAAC